MGKRKRAIVIEDEPNDPLNDLELDADSLRKLEEQKATEEWLAEFQSRFSEQPVRVQVEKFEDGEWSICRKYPLANFDHEAVRDEFGGGRYRATLYEPSGRYVKGGRNYFKFAAPLPKKDEATRAGNPLENPAIAMMIESMKSQTSMLLGLAQSMIAAQGGKASNVGELVDALSKMHTMAPKADKPMDSFKETLGLMKLFKEATGDEGSEKGGFMSEVREFLEMAPLLKEGLPALRAALPISGAGVPANGNPAAPKPPGGAAPMDPLTTRIIQLVPNFVAAAKAASPVQTWAEFLLDKLDEEIMPVLIPQMKAQYGPLVENEEDVYDILIKYAKDPKSRDSIYTSIPPLAPYQEWCNRVIETALKTLTDENSGATVILSAATPEPSNGQ